VIVHRKGDLPALSLGKCSHVASKDFLVCYCLEEWSALRRDLYFTTHFQETDVYAPGGFQNRNPKSKRMQTHALEHAGTAIGTDPQYLQKLYYPLWGPGNVFGIATGYGLDGPWIDSRWGEIFLTCPDRPWGPPSLLYNGYLVFPGGRKRLGCDPEPSPPSSDEV
jgi:hypothetical protein